MYIMKAKGMCMMQNRNGRQNKRQLVIVVGDETGGRGAATVSLE